MTAPKRWGNAEREAFKGVARVLGAQFETRKIFGPCNMAWREEETVVFAGQSVESHVSVTFQLDGTVVCSIWDSFAGRGAANNRLLEGGLRAWLKAVL